MTQVRRLFLFLCILVLGSRAQEVTVDDVGNVQPACDCKVECQQVVSASSRSLQECRNQASASKSEADSLQARLQGTIQSLDADLKKAREESQAQIAKLSSEKVDVQKKLEESDRFWNELRNQVIALQSEKANLQTKLEESTHSLEESKILMDQSNAQLVKVSKEKADAQRFLEDSNRRVAATKQKLDEANAQIGVINAEKAELQRKLQESSGSTDDTKRLLNEANAQLDIVKTEKADLQRKLEESQGKTSDAHRLLAESSSQVDTMKTERANLQKTLEENTQTIATLQTEKETVAKEGSDRAIGLRKKLLEAVEVQKSVEKTARECNEAIVKVAEREAAFKKLAEQEIDDLRSQVQELFPHKAAAAEMEKIVETTKQDLENHMVKSQEEIQQISSQLQQEKSKHKDTSAKFYSSRRDLFAANERMRELHHNATTTYVNVTLIQQDLVVGSEVALQKVMTMWEEFMELVSPYWTSVANFMGPIFKNHVFPALESAADHMYDFYADQVSPFIEDAVDNASDLYDEHIAPSVMEMKTYFRTEIYPHAAPVLDPLMDGFAKAHQSASNGLKHVCVSSRYSLEMMDAEDTEAGQWLVSSLSWVADNSAMVMTSTLYTILGLLVVNMLLLRKSPPKKQTKEKPKKQAKRNTTQQPAKSPQKEADNHQNGQKSPNTAHAGRRHRHRLNKKSQ